MDSSQLKTWTPARAYMLASVLFLIPTGVAGLLANQNFRIGEGATDPSTTDLVFGFLETNGWHSVAALVNGAAALALLLFASDRTVRKGALLMGGGLAALTIALMIPRSIDLLDNMLASNAADNFTHAAQAIGGIVTGSIGRRPSTLKARLAPAGEVAS